MSDIPLTIPSTPTTNRALKSILVSPGVLPASPTSPTTTTPGTPRSNTASDYGLAPVAPPVTPPRTNHHSRARSPPQSPTSPVSPSKVRFAPLPAGRKEERRRATDDRVPWGPAPPLLLPALLEPPRSPPRDSKAYRALRSAYMADLTRTGAISEEDIPEDDEDTYEVRRRVRGY